MHMYLHIESVMWKRKQLHKPVEDKLKSNGGKLCIRMQCISYTIKHIRLLVNVLQGIFWNEYTFYKNFREIKMVELKV